jgi:hypothetical protein
MVFRSDRQAGAGRLKKTQQSLVITGISLDFTLNACKEILMEKIRSRIDITIVTISREVNKTSGLYRALRRRLGGSESLADEFLARILDTRQPLEEIIELGKHCRNPVKLYIYDGLPICGLIIKDRNQRSEVMRVSLYTEIFPTRRHPVVEIHTSRGDGRMVRDIFDRYFEEIRDMSKRS